MRLHARTQEEHLKRIDSFEEAGDTEGINKALRDAFNDYYDDEAFQAWVCFLAYSSEVAEYLELMEEFLKQYPLSTYPVKVDFAEHLILEGELDMGASEARHYLALMYESNLLPTIGEVELIANAVGRGFMLLTSVYTEMAARSYSIRLIREALSFPIDSESKESLTEELENLEKELRETPALQKADAKWEGFFQNGSGAKDLAYACNARGFAILQKRVELLSEWFQENPGKMLPKEEIYQIIYTTDEGKFILV
ncbi:MAG: hypothetical protein SFY68_08635 [Candidatus Sumerlaeia bacterium]|nr:hypothetical protein [Candidatus Sumerlaeia bacterium]